MIIIYVIIIKFTAIEYCKFCLSSKEDHPDALHHPVGGVHWIDGLSQMKGLVVSCARQL